MDRSPRRSDGPGQTAANEPSGQLPPARPSEATPLPAALSRQRWRIVFGRPSASSDRTHRELAEEWTGRLIDAGLPLARPEGRPRPPLAFAAPLPVRMAAAGEYADLLLADRLPVRTVREIVAASMPAELTMIDLFDVWLGAPALAAILTAADYRVTMTPPPPDVAALAEAAGRLLERPRIERERDRAGRAVRYDLRPLVETIVPDTPLGLRIRTLFHPERGAGRPEEVLAALAEVLGQPIDVQAIVRERLILDDRRPS